MKRTITSTLAALAVTLFASPAQASGLNNAVTSIAFADTKIADCAFQSGEDYESYRKAVLEEVIARGMRLKGFSREAAEAETRDLIDRRAGKLFPGPDADRCDNGIRAHLTRLHKSLADPAMRDLILEQVTRRYPWDERRPLPYSSTEAKSYVYDNLVPIFEQTIRLHWNNDGESACENLDVVDVAIVEAEFVETQNLPFFIEGPNQYVEDWTVRCGETRRVFRTTFAQSSIGPIGRYTVREVTE